MDKKIISSILLSALLVSATTACSNKRTMQESNTSEITTVAKVEITANLPEKNMNGKTFTFLTNNWPGEAVWTMNDIFVEELNGGLMNDAKYMRNSNVESKYNCKIEEVNIDAPDAAAKKLSASVLAGDNAYDLYISRMQQYQKLGSEGFLADLNDLPYVDFSKPWWDENSVKALSICNQLYAVCGDITTMDKAATSAIVFNKKLLEDYSLANPYDLVKSGDWTLETFSAILKQVSDDLNGDGEMNENDRFGFMYQRDTLLSFLSGSGEMIARKNVDDIPYISLTEESAVTKMLNVMDVLYDEATCYNSMFLKGDFNVGMNAMFQNNQSLFMWIRMANVEPLRTMKTDFGILPIPKKDKQQEQYSSDVNAFTGICLTVPKSNTDLENTGIFLEALAYEGKKILQPAYYTTLLNGIVARDEESTEMLQIIFSNRTFDVGAIGTYGGLHEILYLPMTFDRNVTSYVEKRIQKANKEIEKLAKKMQENEN